MESTRRRRYAIMGDGITVQGQSLEEAIALFRAQRSPDPEPGRVEEPVKAPDDAPVTAT